jgi:hypothetical protein
MIGSRRELHNLMEKTIDKNLRSMEERGEFSDYAVKTNIIESNCQVDDIPKVFSDYVIQLRPTQDKFLYIMLIRPNKGKTFVLYLDSFFQRYWKLYSIEESTTINRFIDHFTHALIKIDSLWMPHQMLDNLERDYVNAGFSIKFKQEILQENELSEDEVIQLTMRLWSRGSPARRIVAILEENNLPITKTSTRLLHIIDDEIKFFDEVYFDGRVTISKGTDIEEHIHFVNHIIDDYSEKMKRIENNRMYLESFKGGLKTSGHPFEILFSKSFSLEILSEKITNSTNPFRMWGVIHDNENDFLRIAGVDVHTGDKFSMDLTSRYMRIYLPKNACGNLIFRLYTNIQQSLDPGVKIRDQFGGIF